MVSQEDKDYAVQTRSVSKTFKDFWLRPRVRAVNDLNLNIERGLVYGLLGPNGSGKSTTIKMLLGLLYPSEGHIAVLGQPPTNVAVKKKIGYLPEESYLYRFLNAYETLDYYGRLFHIPRTERKARVGQLLEMVGLDVAAHRPLSEYSKGMQRRLGLAQALINDPELLILDEPTTGMDPPGTRKIKDLILALKGKTTVILSSHLLDVVEDVSDRIAMLYGGRMLREGTVAELLEVGEETHLKIQNPSEQALNRVSDILEGEGSPILEVSRPRRKLESLFMGVIEEARTKGITSSGAQQGGDVAGFLKQEDQTKKVISDLLGEDSPQPETVQEAIPSPTEPETKEEESPKIDPAAVKAKLTPIAPLEEEVKTEVVTEFEQATDQATSEEAQVISEVSDTKTDSQPEPAPETEEVQDVEITQTPVEPVQDQVNSAITSEVEDSAKPVFKDLSGNAKETKKESSVDRSVLDDLL